MKKAISIAVILVLLLGLGYFAYQKFIGSSVKAPTTDQNQGDSTQQPIDSQTKGWITYANAKYNFELKYPADFFDPNQQPILFAGDCNYSVFPKQCPNIDNAVVSELVSQGGDLQTLKGNFANSGYWDNPGGTKQNINNTSYCLYYTGDAGAGHSFNYFYFATVKSNKCLIVYLATSTENCDNYLPIESGNNQQAQNYNNCLTKNENQPKLLDKIISTFKFTK